MNVQLQLWAPPGDMHPAAISVVNAKERIFLSHLMQQGGIAHLLRSGGVRALFAPIELITALRAVYRRVDADLLPCQLVAKRFASCRRRQAAFGKRSGHRHAVT